MRVLLIEDHPRIVSYLQKGLNSEGFMTDIAMDGQEGLYLAINQSYDVIILDIMLPQIDGWSLLTVLRTKYPHLPILLLTAKDSVEDRVKGLELGADDYLIKPFAFSELVARLHTILRRSQNTTSLSIIQIDDLKIYPMQYRVTRDQQIIQLTQKEFMLLLLLAEHLGKPLSRTYIAEKVWDIHFDSDTNIIDVAIKRLREKIDKPFHTSLIHTVRGVGYVMEIR